MREADHQLAPEPQAAKTVHQCPPDGQQVVPCCGMTPFDLSRTDRMTADPSMVTCNGIPQEAREAATGRSLPSGVIEITDVDGNRWRYPLAEFLNRREEITGLVRRLHRKQLWLAENLALGSFFEVERDAGGMVTALRPLPGGRVEFDGEWYILRRDPHDLTRSRTD